MVKMIGKEPNPFGLLKKKEIIAILDGDTKYSEYEFYDGTTVMVAMPYLSGPDLCGVSTWIANDLYLGWYLISADGNTSTTKWNTA